MNPPNVSSFSCLSRKKAPVEQEWRGIPRVQLQPEILRELYIAINFIQMQNSVANNSGRK